MTIPQWRKKYRYNYCQECGRPMKNLKRHGHTKVCSEICKIMWEYKRRHRWWKKKQSWKKGVMIMNRNRRLKKFLKKKDDN